MCIPHHQAVGKEFEQTYPGNWYVLCIFSYPWVMLFVLPDEVGYILTKPHRKNKENWLNLKAHHLRPFNVIIFVVCFTEIDELCHVLFIFQNICALLKSLIL